MTVTDRTVERVESRAITAEWPMAEKPLPPYFFGMIRPKKPWSFRNCQTSGDRSPAWLTSQSVTMPQTSSTGPSRKACSSSVRSLGLKAKSRSQSGLPEKSSPSHQTVPASRAAASVSLMRGRIGEISLKTVGVTRARRRGVGPKSMTGTSHRARTQSQEPPRAAGPPNRPTRTSSQAEAEAAKALFR